MTGKEMNRRGFLKGAVLSAIAGLLGIGAKVVAEEPEEIEPLNYFFSVPPAMSGLYTLSWSYNGHYGVEVLEC